MYVATGFNKWGMTSAMVAAQILCDLITGRKKDSFNVFSPSRTILRPQLAVNAFEAVVHLVNFKPKRCPHLGCALNGIRMNTPGTALATGSRFDATGKLIDNPATGNKKF